MAELQIELGPTSGNPSPDRDDEPSPSLEPGGSEADLEAARLSGAREVLRALDNRNAKGLLSALSDLLTLLRPED